ncbi:MAG: PP2C family serine/threonine-protein phosphatase [Chloroherpetonaceae bacterium]|nr:protein phosphatase 2C domain-containing protein [Chthonomonadaceae bacterium]MDW8209180.1 PP2C family serine/threonine-protein phosphatase [Chloroherpetonaceae bacterium]
MKRVTWRVAAASVCGTAHERAGMPCQDACGWRLLPGGVLLAAVADGAGSATLAEVGAQIAVQTALSALTQAARTYSGALSVAATEEWIRRSVMATREAVQTEAAVQATPEREFACTLIALVATPRFVIAAQIGDGATVVQDASGGMSTLTAPNEEGYINETHFLTDPDAMAHLHVHCCESRITAVAALTDGLQRLALKLPEAQPHRPFFEPLFRFVAESDSSMAETRLSALLRSPRITQRADDDLTLLLATHAGVAVSPE